MTNYDFLILSPVEFEKLTCALLQKELGLRLEMFSEGKDKGIDLRHYLVKGKNIIVQVKRYKTYNSLFNSLRNEYKKVQLLTPNRYIISTSVSLSVDQKQKIYELFTPFILNQSDIYGKDDLNNLLSKYPTIEEQQYKLWLSSSVVLNRLVKSKVYNQSSFEKDRIKETVSIYVKNQSFEKAIVFLKRFRYVIISGIPGIGKTTLTRILVYHFLSKGYEEFIYLSDSINEGIEMYNEERSQIFVFDDFLGRNFLENKLRTNEEKQLLLFIERIARSENKLLILATREYILRQAQKTFDLLDSPEIELSKCIIDLSQYTRIVRAEILYNHLFFSNVPREYLNSILSNRNYFKIINHQNYNPRIIERITSRFYWPKLKADEFFDKFISFLDNPDSVWKHAYENQISSLSRLFLAVLMTCGGPILSKDLFRMLEIFFSNNPSLIPDIFSDYSFKSSLRELENTFIKIDRGQGKEIIIDYINPSVQDFLVNYYKNNPRIVEQIVASSIFFNQIYKVFYYKKFESEFDGNRIPFSPSQLLVIENKLKNDISELESSRLKLSTRAYGKNRIYVKKTDFSMLEKLSIVSSEFFTTKKNWASSLVMERLNDIIDLGEFSLSDISSNDYDFLLDIIENLKEFYVFKEKNIINEFTQESNSIEEVQLLVRFFDIFPDTFHDISSSGQFKENIFEVLSEIAYDIEDEYIEDLIIQIEEVAQELDVYYEEIIEDLNYRKEEYDKKHEEEWYDDGDFQVRNTNTYFESESIDNMFNSLKEK